MYTNGIELYFSFRFSFVSPGNGFLRSFYVALCASNPFLLIPQSSPRCVCWALPTCPSDPLSILLSALGSDTLWTVSTRFPFLPASSWVWPLEGTISRSEGEVRCLSDLMGWGSSGHIPLPTATGHAQVQRPPCPRLFGHMGFPVPCWYI